MGLADALRRMPEGNFYYNNDGKLIGKPSAQVASRQYADRGDVDAIESAMIQPDDLLGLPAKAVMMPLAKVLREGGEMAVEKVAKKLMPDSISVGPSTFAPKAIGDKPLYREMDRDRMGDMLSNLFANSPEKGSVGKSFLTDDKTLALGQGGNKGVMATFDGNLVSGASHVKPGANVIGGGEFVSDYIHRDALKSFVLPKGTVLKGVGKVFANRNFDREVLEDGSRVFTRKQ